GDGAKLRQAREHFGPVRGGIVSPGRRRARGDRALRPRLGRSDHAPTHAAPGAGARSAGCARRVGMSTAAAATDTTMKKYRLSVQSARRAFAAFLAPIRFEELPCRSATPALFSRS